MDEYDRRLEESYHYATTDECDDVVVLSMSDIDSRVQQLLTTFQGNGYFDVEAQIVYFQEQT
jgi:hypothetical protein